MKGTKGFSIPCVAFRYDAPIQAASASRNFYLRVFLEPVPALIPGIILNIFFMCRGSGWLAASVNPPSAPGSEQGSDVMDD